MGLDLAGETGVDVELRWDASGGSHGWKWHVLWSDGASVPAMRGHVERLARWLRVLDPARLHYSRVVRPRSFAVAMVRNVRLGQPPLGGHIVGWLFQHVGDSGYPERGDAGDLVLADVLGQLGGWRVEEMPAVLDRVGLVGLRAELAAADNVVSLRRPARGEGR